jgi:hypothetical protein
MTRYTNIRVYAAWQKPKAHFCTIALASWLIVTAHYREGKQMITIQTQYYGPTNHYPSRIRAWDCNGRSVWHTYGQQDTTDKEHIAAANKLARKCNKVYKASFGMDAFAWTTDWIMGDTAKGKVFVIASDTPWKPDLGKA